MTVNDTTSSGSAVEFRRSVPSATVLSRDYLTVRPVIDWMKRTGAAYARGVLLDFGCGNKPYEPILAAGVGRYVGADVEQNRFGTVDIIFEPGDALPLGDCSVDTVLSTQVLEHVAEPQAYLREVARILKPGGHVILTCPASFMLHEEPHDYYRFTRYGIAHLLGQCQLNIVSLETAGGAWRLLGQILLNHRAFGRRISVPLVSKAVDLVWIAGVNVLCSLLDRFNTNTKDTANYMIIARK